MNSADCGFYRIATTREEKKECLKQWELIRESALSIRECYEMETENNYGKKIMYEIKDDVYEPQDNNQYSNMERINRSICYNLFNTRPLLDWFWETMYYPVPVRLDVPLRFDILTI